MNVVVCVFVLTTISHFLSIYLLSPLLHTRAHTNYTTPSRSAAPVHRTSSLCRRQRRAISRRVQPDAGADGPAEARADAAAAAASAAVALKRHTLAMHNMVVTWYRFT